MRFQGTHSRRTVKFLTRAGAIGCGMERLEPRALCSAVSWDGGAGDSLWNSPLNWSGDVVPGSGDDVTIDVATNPTVHFSGGTATINSLLTRENLSIDGSRLTINATAQVDGAVAMTLAGGTLEGGTYAYSNGGALAFSTGGGTLKDVAANTDLLLDAANKMVVLQGSTSFGAVRLGAGAILAMAPGYTLTSLVSAEGVGAAGRTILVAYGGAGTVTIAPTGSIRQTSDTLSTLTIQDSSLATIQNDGVIESDGRTINLSVSTFKNNGAVKALTGAITFSGASMTNTATGAIIADKANLLFQSATWSDAGTISVNASTWVLGGSFKTSEINFAGLTRTLGTVSTPGRWTMPIPRWRSTPRPDPGSWTAEESAAGRSR